MDRSTDVEGTPLAKHNETGLGMRWCLQGPTETAWTRSHVLAPDALLSSKAQSSSKYDTKTKAARHVQGVQGTAAASIRVFTERCMRRRVHRKIHSSKGVQVVEGPERGLSREGSIAARRFRMR